MSGAMVSALGLLVFGAAQALGWSAVYLAARRTPPVRASLPDVPPHVLGTELTYAEMGDYAPAGPARIVPPKRAPVLPAPQRGKFLTPAEIRARIDYFRRWGAAPVTFLNRRRMRAEYRALKSEILLARLHEVAARGGLQGAVRNRAWVADETRQVERDLMAAMTVALPRGPTESREAWQARRRAMLATWRDEPTPVETTDASK
jgi:hypothetical protein